MRKRKFAWKPVRRAKRIRRGVLATIRASASRKSENENRMGITWRSRPGTLRERDFDAFDRNVLAAWRMRRKIERWLFGRPKKPESSLAADFVAREV